MVFRVNCEIKFFLHIYWLWSCLSLANCDWCFIQIFKATLFIRVAYIHKFERLTMTYITEISQKLLKLCFSTYFSFPPWLRNNIAGSVFGKISIYFCLISIFCIVYIDTVYRMNALLYTNDLVYNTLESFAKCRSYCYFTELILCQQIDKNVTEVVQDQYAVGCLGALVNTHPITL